MAPGAGGGGRGAESRRLCRPTARLPTAPPRPGEGGWGDPQGSWHNSSLPLILHSALSSLLTPTTPYHRLARWAPGRSLSLHFFRMAFKQSLVQKPGCIRTRASHSCSLSLSTWSLLRGRLTGHLPQGEWEEDVFGIPSLDELFTLTFQSEEDKQLQDELEMLVERLGVSHDNVNVSGGLFGAFPLGCFITF